MPDERPKVRWQGLLLTPPTEEELRVHAAWLECNNETPTPAECFFCWAASGSHPTPEEGR